MLLIGPLLGQVDNRFNVFSWEQYSQVGGVNSISEDYSYFYFGTENANYSSPRNKVSINRTYLF